MSKVHREENCTVPFCEECLARIKGVADVARGMKDQNTPTNTLEEIWYTPRDIATNKLIVNSKGNGDYGFVLRLIKQGALKAEIWNKHSSSKTPYYVVSEHEIERFNSRFTKKSSSLAEVKIVFDSEQKRLYMKDGSDQLTEIWVLGMGVPAQLMFGELETPNQKTKSTLYWASAGYTKEENGVIKRRTK